MSMHSKSLPPPTDEQAQRIELAKTRGCIACLMQNLPEQCGRVEYHHLLVGGLRAGHRYGVALGEWHHRGVGPFKPAAAEEFFGPALARGSKTFHEEFGSDQELMYYQDDLLGYDRVQLPASAERIRDRQTTRSPKTIARVAA
jgi:hypothetical protein